MIDQSAWSRQKVQIHKNTKEGKGKVETGKLIITAGKLIIIQPLTNFLFKI